MGGGGVAFHHTDLCLLCQTFVSIILELYAYEVEVSLHKKYVIIRDKSLETQGTKPHKGPAKSPLRDHQTACVAQADLSICWSYMPHYCKTNVAAHLERF